MTPETASREIAEVTGRTGRGRNRRFVNVVDLTPEGVNRWRIANGLAPLAVCPTCGKLVNDRSGAFCQC